MEGGSRSASARCSRTISGKRVETAAGWVIVAESSLSPWVIPAPTAQAHRQSSQHVPSSLPEQ